MFDRRRNKVGREELMKGRTDAKEDSEGGTLWKLNLLLQIQTAVIN